MDWNNAISFDNQNKSIVEVPVSLKKNFIFNSTIQSSVSTNSLFFIKEPNNEFEIYFLNISSNIDTPKTELSLRAILENQTAPQFEGAIIVINQENKVVEFSSLFSGVEVKKKQKDLYKYAPKSWTCYEVVEVFSDGSVRHTGITFCTGSGAGDSGGDSGDYGYVGGGGTKTTTENDDKIINELEGKADCTFQKLKNNSILAETLKEFIGEETPVHLILTQESDLRNSSGQLLNGRTDYGDSYYITITLNTEQAINRPSLDVARTILHEAIHAEIYRKIKSTTTDISKIIVDKDSWPSLFDYYNKYPTNPHHNYMADYYRAAIEKGLREYAKSIGQTYPDQLYEDLAWVGLRGTEAWDNMYADPIYTKNEQERILNSVIKFSNSGKNECV